nr:immunoglobulin light chain junction region [Macaca mulatta]
DYYCSSYTDGFTWVF